MKIIICISFIVIALSLNSCKYECEGFPDSELQWLPYRVGDIIKYTDDRDTIEFTVDDFSKTESSSYRGLVMDYECYSSCYYQTSKAALGYQLREEYKFGYDWGMHIQISDNDKFKFNIWEKKSYSDSIKLEYKQDTLIGLKKYYEVFLVSKDTFANSPNIAWVIIAKDKGIVEFYDYKLKRKWRLINDND